MLTTICPKLYSKASLLFCLFKEHMDVLKTKIYFTMNDILHPASHKRLHARCIYTMIHATKLMNNAMQIMQMCVFPTIT